MGSVICTSGPALKRSSISVHWLISPAGELTIRRTDFGTTGLRDTLRDGRLGAFTNGLIVIDNVLWHGDVINPDDHSLDTEAIREFNRKIHADTRVVISLATVGDGLMLACKL